MKLNKTVLYILHLFSLLLLMCLAVKFYTSTEAEPFAYFLPISYLVLGVLLGVSQLLTNKFISKPILKNVSVVLHHVIYLLGIFSLHYYLFGSAGYQYLYCALLGLLLSALVYLTSCETLKSFYHLSMFVIASLVIAISLRLLGIPGVILAGFSITHAAFGYLQNSDEKTVLSKAAIIYFSIGFIAARAFLQSYLETSGYAGLGIVITHPYSFVALMMGMALPLLFQELRENGYLSIIDIHLLLGILLPLMLWMVLPMRALGAIGMSLSVTIFTLGVLQKLDLTWSLLAPMFLWMVNLLMPFFKDEAQATRWDKMDTIITAIVLFAIYLWGRNFIKNKFFKSAVVG